MPSNVTHFAIHADDVDRARKFYEAVFGWKFEAWGPPGFYMIKTGSDADPGIHGSLQQRREPVSGKGMIGYECTIGVDSVDDIAEAIDRHGGRVTMGKMHIPTVGWLIQFEDTEGNVVGAMRYEAHR